MHQSIVFEVTPHPGRTGFDLSCDRLLPYCMWYTKLYDAVLFAMQTGRDYSGEIRIFDRRGDCLETVRFSPRRSRADSWPEFGVA
jgi:hypothetical protein